MWLAARMADRRLSTRQVEIGMAAHGHRVGRSSVSDYQSDKVVPPMEKAPAFAAYFGVPEEEVLDLIRRSRPAPPPVPGRPDVAAELAEVKRILGQIGERLAAGPVPWIQTGISPTTPARFLERASGTVRPMIVQDDLLAAEGLRAGSVAWVEPTGVAAEGKIVCVGAGDAARLKRYEPDDEVSGVVVLVQYSPP